jgi:hypothetical protein
MLWASGRRRTSFSVARVLAVLSLALVLPIWMGVLDGHGAGRGFRSSSAQRLDVFVLPAEHSPLRDKLTEVVLVQTTSRMMFVFDRSSQRVIGIPTARIDHVDFRSVVDER